MAKKPVVVPIASKSESSFSWTTPQMLRDLADDIEREEVIVEYGVLLFIERNKDGRRRPRRYFVNTNGESEARLALIHLKMTCDGMFSE